MSGSEEKRAHQPTDQADGEGSWTVVKRRRRRGKYRQTEVKSPHSDGDERTPTIGSCPPPEQKSEETSNPGAASSTTPTPPHGQTRTSNHLSKRQRRRQTREMARKERQLGETPSNEQPKRPDDRRTVPSRTQEAEVVRQAAPRASANLPENCAPKELGNRSQTRAENPTTVERIPAKEVPPRDVKHSVQTAGQDSTQPLGPARVATNSYAYPSSLFVPGRVGGKNLTFLVDTGCTHNLLSRTVFDRLPAAIRQQMNSQESTATMADGSGLPIYGNIRLKGRLRNVKFETDFLVCRISDDGILGMSFLREQDCSIACDKGLLIVHGTPVQCTDKAGRLLTNKVQVVRTLVLPPEAEVQVCCRLNSEPSSPIGLIESLLGQDTGLAVAATLGKPTADGKVIVRCLNLTSEPQQLRSGLVIGLYQPVEEDQVEESSVHARSVLDDAPSTLRADCPEHVRPLLEQTKEVCETTDQYRRMAHLLTVYGDVFSQGDTDVGRTDLVQHSIPLVEGTKPIRQPPRRLGAEKDKEVEEQVAQLVQRGMVEPTDGSWSSPVVLVRKKDQSWRLCVDYRRLNAVTRKDAYPLPRIDDSLDALTGSIFFSTLDLVSGYWQVPLDEDAQQRSAFVTRGGLWRWKVLPFGLTSAPATFERLMERVLKGLQWRTLLLYLDDIIVFSKDFDSHLTRLEEVFQRFRAARLKLKPGKCRLFQREVNYLGHVVSQTGVATDPDKVDAVRNWPQPRCVQEVRSFLGFVGYYRRFCPDFATTAKPLNVLTSKETAFRWGPDEENAFQELKQRMVEAPILTYPDPSRPYILDTDASNEAAGGVLSQEVDGEEKVVAYFSKTFSPPQKNYCVTRRELLAVIMAVTHFRPYLYGRKFKLRTVHASLIWLYKRTEPSPDSSVVRAVGRI